MGEHTASIFFDHGIHDNIDTVAPRQLLKVRVTFKQPRADEMPANDEFQHLIALEEGLQAAVQEHESIYVGRVTTGGHRHFYIYTSESDEVWSTRLEAVGTSPGYPLAFALKRTRATMDTGRSCIRQTTIGRSSRIACDRGAWKKG